MNNSAISSLGPLIDRYDAFLFDQFGVLHDGRRAYSGVASLLSDLAARGKKLAVVTNSAKSSRQNEARLNAMGITTEGLLVVSSGELTRITLQEKWLGARIAIIDRDGDDYDLEKLDIRRVDDPCTADLVLILQSDAPQLSLEEYRKRLMPAAIQGVPALCANPDLEMLTRSGHQPAAGAVAKVYEELGGQVHYIGKPHPMIFAHCLEKLAIDDPSRSLMVGDSFDHDILGASRAGLRSALVMTGLAKDMLEDEIDRCSAATAKPDHVLVRLGTP